MKNDKKLGPSGPWIIFSGIPMAVGAVFFVLTEPNNSLEHAVGEKAFPYALAGVAAAIMITGIVLYDHFPKRLVIPFGIVGWVIFTSLFCWFFWFGPGALKM
jgi:hypothetical protein